jgi:hypothetical protein
MPRCGTDFDEDPSELDAEGRCALTCPVAPVFGQALTRAGAQINIHVPYSRCVLTDHGAFVLMNIYFPASRCGERASFKLRFYRAFEMRVRALQVRAQFYVLPTTSHGRRLRFLVLTELTFVHVGRASVEVSFGLKYHAIEGSASRILGFTVL